VKPQQRHNPSADGHGDSRLKLCGAHLHRHAAVMSAAEVAFARFFVDVKGNKDRNTWLVEREGNPTIPDLYYILTSVDEKREKDQFFFILTQDEARALRNKHKQERGGKGALDPGGKFIGFPFNYPRDFENRCFWPLWEQVLALVETGVAHGITSRFVLEALQRNGGGRLWSIDVPPLLRTAPYS
jgi:hypothetical protein